MSQLNGGIIDTEEKRAALRYWIFAHQRDGNVPLLGSNIEELAKHPYFPPLLEQRDNAFLLFGELTRGPGEYAQIDSRQYQHKIGCKFHLTVIELIRSLCRSGWADIRNDVAADGINVVDAALTFDGWLELENLSRRHPSGRTAFMAMPFNKPDLYNEWLPKLRTAIKETGFDLRRVDDEPRPGLIDLKLQIKRARFLIVELTYANLGAYWEAGFAEGLGKPVIYTCREGQDVHFDVAHSFRVIWSPDKIQDALRQVKSVIRNSLPDAHQNEHS